MRGVAKAEEIARDRALKGVKGVEPESLLLEVLSVEGITGDFFFHAPRRQILDKFSLTRPTYNFCELCTLS